MQSLSDIRALLAERGLRPKRRLGQHFLHDQNLLGKLVEAAGVGPGDLVLEVGPGTGALTEALLDAGVRVVACEIDRDLAALIRDRLGDRLVLVEGDCLGPGRTLNPELAAALGDRPFTLVANLPYQVASPLIIALLAGRLQCRGLFVTIQKEVADRIAAEPGTKDYGALTVIVQALANVGVIARLPPQCFWPRPRVTSTMFAIRPRPDHGIDDPQALARFAVALFTKRRKQLGTIFGRDTSWPAGVTAELRPEALTPKQIHELSGSPGALRPQGS